MSPQLRRLRSVRKLLRAFAADPARYRDTSTAAEAAKVAYVTAWRHIWDLCHQGYLQKHPLDVGLWRITERGQNYLAYLDEHLATTGEESTP